MIDAMEPRQNEATEEPPPLEKDRSEIRTAFIPACGTLCDAFWWACRSQPPKSSD